MPTFQKLSLVLCLGLLLAGCKDDFLELAPLSNANANNFYKTKADFDLAVNAAYSTLYVTFAPESGISYAAEQMSDNATLYNVAGIQADRWAFKDYALNPSNTEVYRFWREHYSALFSVNIVLDRIEAAELDEAYKDQVRAEMRFLRGMYYYYMVQMWGPVPLVTKPLTAEESYDYLRAPEAEIYAQITSDLTFAAERLPLTTQVPALGRASKGAAQTFLAKVYLTQGDKAAATQQLQAVVSSGQYALLDDYDDLWAVANKNTQESIFEIQYLGGAGNPFSPYWTSFSPTENFTLTQYGGGMNQVTDDLYNEFEEGDPRRERTIALGYTNNAGTFVSIKFPYKWVDTNAVIVNGRELADNNFMVLRYADVLLLLTEATGDPSYLNQVRARVGLPGFGEAGYPSDLYPTVERALEHERRVELALEFHRFFDLKRTGRAVEVLQAKGKPVTEGKLVMPIPEMVRQQNPGIEQNAAY
ncbi:SusD family protein [Catalinimonas alkaloidigena]|uniref:SusD family protein n=1 Tax=Catalinimonas alkaloidigena TaxID=1075417 RepID=A0A1G9IUX3_9BACT|nr:RagB/SusD family nutrient uptake outer membrane protein [Catalinimonas alkaloidigena]SDL28997.1 SusD family protein [Catalinimonas alkaloidigena]